jgi:PhnB protein
VKKLPNGKVMHAEFSIGDSPLMFSEEMPEHGSKAPGKDELRASAVWVYTKSVDDMYTKAIEAGGISKQEPMDLFWGDRLASVVDPSGHVWHIATHMEDLSDEEIDRRAEKFSEQSMSKKVGS